MPEKFLSEFVSVRGRLSRFDGLEKPATIDLTQIHRHGDGVLATIAAEAPLLGKGLRGGGATWIELRFAPFA